MRLAPGVHAVMALAFALLALAFLIAGDFSVAGGLFAIALMWGLYAHVQVRWNRAHGHPLWSYAYDPWTFRSGRDASGAWVTRRADDPAEPLLDGPVNPWPQLADDDTAAGPLTADLLPFRLTGPPGHGHENWRRGSFLTRRDVEHVLARPRGAFGLIETDPTPTFSWLTVAEARRLWRDRVGSNFTEDAVAGDESRPPPYRALVCESPQGPLTLFEPSID